MSARHLALHGKEMKPGLYNVPKDVDYDIAMMKVKAMGLGLDKLTAAQEAYISSTGE